MWLFFNYLTTGNSTFLGSNSYIVRMADDNNMDVSTTTGFWDVKPILAFMSSIVCHDWKLLVLRGFFKHKKKAMIIWGMRCLLC